MAKKRKYIDITKILVLKCVCKVIYVLDDAKMRSNKVISSMHWMMLKCVHKVIYVLGNAGKRIPIECIA